MTRTSPTLDELNTWLGQSKQWADRRHLCTLVWMVIGLICSGCVSLTEWTLYVESRAIFAHRQRTLVAGFAQSACSAPRKSHREAALTTWDEPEITLIETPTTVGAYCLIRISVQYHGRAVPMASAIADCTQWHGRA